jgi:cytochrome P450
MIVAGHETTLDLLTNAVCALLTHPDQLALVLGGQHPWTAVIEEILRWDSPLGCPAYFGEAADRFDITRPTKRHVMFGHGPHICPGAHLARLEAEVALPALFARFPNLAMAVPVGEFTPIPSIVNNCATTLPVVLAP